MYHRENINENLLACLYQHHESIESLVDDLRTIIDGLDYLKESDYHVIDDQFAKVYFKLNKLYEELRFS